MFPHRDEISILFSLPAYAIILCEYLVFIHHWLSSHNMVLLQLVRLFPIESSQFTIFNPTRAVWFFCFWNSWLTLAILLELPLKIKLRYCSYSTLVTDLFLIQYDSFVKLLHRIQLLHQRQLYRNALSEHF